MLNSIEISNYKNFRKLTIDNLGSVNLIVGRNNAGKSTLLEAVSLLASGANINWIKDLLEIRGMSASLPVNVEQPDVIELENYRSLCYNRDYETFKTQGIRIAGSRGEGSEAEETMVEIKIVDLVETTEISENGDVTKRRIVAGNDKDGVIVDGESRPGLSITFNDNRVIFTIGSIPRRFSVGEKNTPFEYVRTAEFIGDRNPQLFDKVALTPLEPMLIEALRIISPGIEAVNFLKDDTRPQRMWAQRHDGDNRVPYVILDGAAEKLRLSTMGDGINRILTIILSMLNCRDGILLIDEFENGLHYTVQTSLWKLIGRLSEELGIQVFATTHSRDCIKSFIAAGKDREGNRLIRLEARGDREVAVMYADADEFDYISENDVETR